MIGSDGEKESVAQLSRQCRAAHGWRGRKKRQAEPAFFHGRSNYFEAAGAAAAAEAAGAEAAAEADAFLAALGAEAAAEAAAEADAEADAGEAIAEVANRTAAAATISCFILYP